MHLSADRHSSRPHLPRINGATRKLPTGCPHCGCKKLVRKGIRRKKLEIVQLWQCTYCRRVFTPLPPAARNTTDPPRVIIDALTTYNLGYPLAETARRLRGRGYSVSSSSLSRWIATYRSLATYERLRSRGLALFPPHKTLCTIKLYHRQVYEYAFHRPKLAFLLGAGESAASSKLRTRERQQPRFAVLKDFLESVKDRCPHALFRASDRASQAEGDFIDPNRRTAVPKENTATRMAGLIIPTTANNHLRHSRLQHFMLANDSVTVAVEIPIWLRESDIAAIESRWGITLVPKLPGQERTITGHIDFLQIRNGAIHVLDYKPDATTNKPFAQLTIYALALSHLTAISLFDFKCAWFNEDQYCEFFPRTVLARDTQSSPHSRAA
jgi:transposase-like protein